MLGEEKMMAQDSRTQRVVLSAPRGRGATARLLRVDRDVHDDAVVVRAVGEVDLSCVALLSEQLDRAVALATPPAPVVADLTGVNYLGSCGLALLATAHRQCDQRHTPLRVVANSRAVLRVVEVTGLDTVLSIYPRGAAGVPAPA
jgi:anti-sigma B factor antagonist